MARFAVFLVGVFVLLGTWVLPIPLARAQIITVTNTTATPIPGTGHDYIKMLSETVSPASGSVSLRIEVPMPPGRKLTLPFAFVYNSSGVHYPANIPGSQSVEWFTDTGQATGS